MPQESATHLAVLGADAVWTLQDHLLATVVDVLNDANWQRSGGKAKRPERVQRPGVKDQTKKIGRGARPIAEIHQILRGR